MPVIIGGVPRKLYERPRPQWRTPLVIAVAVLLPVLFAIDRTLTGPIVVAGVFLAMGGLAWSFAVLAFRVLRFLLAILASRFS